MFSLDAIIAADGRLDKLHVSRVISAEVELFTICAKLVHVSLSIVAQRSYQNSSFHVMDLLRIK